MSALTMALVPIILTVAHMEPQALELWRRAPGTRDLRPANASAAPEARPPLRSHPGPGTGLGVPETSNPKQATSTPTYTYMLHIYMYMYMCVCACIHVCMRIYIYIHIIYT